MATLGRESMRDDEVGHNSETPHFDALFVRYDIGNGIINTEHLGALLLSMGYNAAPKILDWALDAMDPNATGEISKFTFLEWFEENADKIEDFQSSAVVSPRSQQQDDLYSELQSAMLEAKHQSKQAEVDYQLLANRLAHLRAEDARTQKRIEEAKRRAREIKALKKRNEKKQRAKQEASEQMQREIKAACEYNNKAQASARERRNQIMAEAASQRAQVVQGTRAERKTRLDQIRQQKEMNQFWLAERSQEIREKEKCAIQQRQAAQKKHEKELLKRGRENLAREHAKRLLSEKKIHCMEAEEAELIAKLRITQKLQQAAYEELEAIMQDEI